MTERGSTPRELGLYVRELRLSLRNNSGAYGFSVMITSVMAMLSALRSPPGPGQIVLFFLGAVASFAIIEAIATRGFTRSLGNQEATKVIALGSSLNLVSIAVAVAVAATTGVVLPATLGWLVGPFAASVAYLLVTAAEMTVARRIEEVREVE
ncbi:hypothetical protein CLV30_1334 [Haloactinopolyspora alba]|uniref:Uncharacterized protein n=1 Tax=Haloactinopolyspora alba TaxID=648780 RepID=A0A2P8D3S9_9ACTN|nr:hypothetical protein [Haloactinopolyspora alba]PSK91871.1 hypothetical protein CLV30_1334 [Haloactinopolyspora alba]